MKIAITGASGFLGRHLCLELSKDGHQVTAVSRGRWQIPGLPTENCFRVEQYTEANLSPILSGHDAIINLVGEPVADQRWTEELRKRILDSRIQSSQSLVTTLLNLPEEKRPKVFLAGSAIGFYGFGEDEKTESSPVGTGFLADVAKIWEASASGAEAKGVRTLFLRTGVVFDSCDGALPKIPPVVIGSGDQQMSWIHVKDWVRAVLFLVKHPTATGAFNLSAPEPTSNRNFVKALCETKGFPFSLPSPEFPLQLALGDRSQIILGSQRVLPQRLLDLRFEFLYPDLGSAMAQIYPDGHYLDKYYNTYLFLPAELTKVFDFFSRAENLEKITPPWLNFHIIGKSTPEIQNGTKIDYRLKIRGVPVQWQSIIDSWQPNAQFVDAQITGPYAKWHHTHTFHSVPGGTLVGDHVVYRLPFGWLGALFGSAYIRADVNKIFTYRSTVLKSIFKAP